MAAKKIISRHLDGELSSGTKAILDEHLAQCSACQAEYTAQQRLWDLLARAEPVQAPDIITAIEARLVERHGLASLLECLRFRTVGYATATAVLVGMFVWTGIWAGTTQYQSGAEEHDKFFAEILTDTPPGLEVVALLDKIGEQP